MLRLKGEVVGHQERRLGKDKHGDEVRGIVVKVAFEAQADCNRTSTAQYFCDTDYALRELPMGQHVEMKLEAVQADGKSKS